MPPVAISTADGTASEAIRNDTFDILANGASDGGSAGVDPTPGIGSLSAPYQTQTKDFIEAVALGMIRGIGAQIRQVQQLFVNQDGTGNPASITTGSFTQASGTKLLIFASGAGFNGGSASLSIDIKLDSTVVGHLKGYSNEAGSHKAISPQLILVAGSAGSHTITLARGAGTSWDANDFMSVTVIEVAGV